MLLDRISKVRNLRPQLELRYSQVVYRKRSTLSYHIAVVKTASTLADAKSTSSELVKEGSVKCIVMGGGFSPDDFNEVRAIATEAGGVAWFRPAFTAPGSTVGKPGSPPSAEEVAESVRKALEAKKDLLNGGHGRDEVWYF